MNSRERFHLCMRFERTDHVPCFEEGLRDDVLETWQRQGLPAGTQLNKLFHYDEREEFSPNLYSQMDPVKLAGRPGGLDRWRKSLDSDDSRRLPRNWKKDLPRWRERQHVLMIQVHDGIFETLGIGDSRTFTRVLYMLADYPEFVRQAMLIHGEFAARLVERMLGEVKVEAAVFSEPIAGNHGALISPRMYQELVLTAYQPLLKALKHCGVETIIMRSYANPRALLPAIFKEDFNCLWAVETEPGAMDYREIRGEIGSELRLIGGIDVDVLRQGEQAIQKEFDSRVKPLLAEGGYIPLADGRVRADMPFAHYRFYRQMLEEAAGMRR